MKTKGMERGWMHPPIDAKSPPPAPGAARPRLSAPLAGSTPRPYYTHAAGECGFILGDVEGSMADALTCCLPEDAKGSQICAGHRVISCKPAENGKPRSGKELIRGLRSYMR